MTTIYDGKLTAWLDSELEKVLDKAIPPVEKYYEGNPGLTIKSVNPMRKQALRELRSIARDYASKQASGQYEQPVNAPGLVDHGFCD